MAIYKFTHTLTWTTSEDYWETFDTDDQEKWNTLLGLLQFDNDDEVKSFPKKAPKDPEIWFSLYSLLNETYLENQDDEYTGEYLEHEYSLHDDKGNFIC